MRTKVVYLIAVRGTDSYLPKYGSGWTRDLDSAWYFTSRSAAERIVDRLDDDSVTIVQAVRHTERIAGMDRHSIRIA